MMRVALSSLAVAAFLAASGAGTGHVAPAKPRCGPRGWTGIVVDTSRIYHGNEVDKMAVADPNNPTPKWPGIPYKSEYGTERTDMRDAASAFVIGRFVVDTMGCVDSTSFESVTASDTAFTGAVRQLLTRLHYTPATKSGHKVRSWVLWKFEFFHQNGAVGPMSP